MGRNKNYGTQDSSDCGGNQEGIRRIKPYEDLVGSLDVDHYLSLT